MPRWYYLNEQSWNNRRIIIDLIVKLFPREITLFLRYFKDISRHASVFSSGGWNSGHRVIGSKSLINIRCMFDLTLTSKRPSLGRRAAINRERGSLSSLYSVTRHVDLFHRWIGNFSENISRSDCRKCRSISSRYPPFRWNIKRRYSPYVCER